MANGSSFVPSGTVEPGADDAVTNDAFYPPLSVAAFADETGITGVFDTALLRGFLDTARIETNLVLATWRSDQTAAPLATTPDTQAVTGEERVTLYRAAVHAQARADLIDTRRDYDTTAKGHDRADALEQTSDTWRRRASVSLSRLTGRGRTTVELI